MSKQPEAQFDLKTGAMMINDSINELFNQDNDDSPENVDYDFLNSSNDDDEVENTKTKSSRKVNESAIDDDEDFEEEDDDDDELNLEEDSDYVKTTKTSSKKSSNSNQEDNYDDNYDDYSDISLVALAIKEEEPELIPFEIKKDMAPKELVSSLKNSIERIANEQLQYLEQKYEDAAQYINYLIQDGDPEVVKQGMLLKQISDIELDESVEETDLEEIVNTGLLQKGITDPEEREALIETFKDKGKLYSKAEETIKIFKNLEKNYIENALFQQRAEQERQQQEYAEFRRKMEDTINKGIVKGLPIKDKKKLYNAIFTPTETVTRYNNEGKKVTVKDTLYRIKFEEYNNDVEQQVAFAQLLIDGFDFTKLVEVAKKSVNEDILKILDNRTDLKRSKKQGDNPWFNL